MTDLTDNPNKKTFKEMTDDEQGALLLAKRKGEAIQHFASLQYFDWCDWVDTNDEKFMENRIYRTKPKSKDTDTSKEAISQVPSSTKKGVSDDLKQRLVKAVEAVYEDAAETCDVVTMDGVGDLIRGKGDEIRARIRELEAKLDDLGAIKEKAHRQGYEQGKAAGDAFGAAIREHVERLEAKLAKAVDAMEVCVNNQPTGLYADHNPFYWTLQTTLAELKGETYE